jgi:Domain of unknown function (DUF4442)
LSFDPRAERLRRRILNPWGFKAYLLGKLPLAACAGLRLEHLDETECRVSLPGGWRTQNPFRSMYFAAQAMAAEMSTGAPAMVLVAGAPASVALILVEIRAVFSKRIQGRASFTFSDVAGMRAAIERAAAAAEAERYTGRSLGRTADGTVASEFEVTWSFKRRTTPSS